MPSHLVIVHHRLNEVDELELFAGCRTAEDPKLMVGLRVSTVTTTYTSGSAGRFPSAIRLRRAELRRSTGMMMDS
jgi:hypothetical protein